MNCNKRFLPLSLCLCSVVCVLLLQFSNFYVSYPLHFTLLFWQELHYCFSILLCQHNGSIFNAEKDMNYCYIGWITLTMEVTCVTWEDKVIVSLNHEMCRTIYTVYIYFGTNPRKRIRLEIENNRKKCCEILFQILHFTHDNCHKHASLVSY
jgi:hypothetical protein